MDKIPWLKVYILVVKAWTQSSKKQQRKPKDQWSEDLRIAEPIQCTSNTSHPRHLTSEWSTERNDQINGEKGAVGVSLRSSAENYYVT